MSWQQQGGPRDPWGGGPRHDDQSPDLEEMLRKGQEHFQRLIPGGFGTRKTMGLIALAIAVLWMFSGLYRVQPGEVGLELLFGRYVTQTTPGLHLWFPRPIGEVLTPDVERTNQIEVGFRGARGGRGAPIRDVPTESLMLTGDQNIIDIDYVVQWRIGNAADYKFNIRDPDSTIKLASESAMREVVGQTTLEDALARKRQDVETRTQRILQRILDGYRAGVLIADVKLQKVEAPKPVIDAFDDVQRARQDKERLRNEAAAYKNDIIPKAKGEAQRMIQEASAYRERLIREAQGEAARFLSVYEAYTGGKNVTRKRLYLERMQEVLRRSDKVILGGGKGIEGVVPYLPLPDIQKRRAAADAGQAEVQ